MMTMVDFAAFMFFSLFLAHAVNGRYVRAIACLVVGCGLQAWTVFA